jgi:hypothetical protein
MNYQDYLTQLTKKPPLFGQPFQEQITPGNQTPGLPDLNFSREEVIDGELPPDLNQKKKVDWGKIFQKYAPAVMGVLGAATGKGAAAASAIDTWNNLQAQKEQKKLQEYQMALEQKNQEMREAQFGMQQEEFARSNQMQDAQYVTLTPEMIGQLPTQYQGLYQPGQKIQRAEIAGLIPQPTAPTIPAFTYDAQTLSAFAQGLDNRNPLKKVFATFGPGTPASAIKDAMDQATQYQNYLLDYDKQHAGSGSDRGNVDLKRQYDAVLAAYNQYKSTVLARKDELGNSKKPMQMVDWLQQPEQAGLLKTYNEFTGSNVQGFQYRYNKKPGQNTASGNTQPSGWFKKNSTPPTGVKPQDWADADWVLMNLPKNVPQSIKAAVNYYKSKIGNEPGQIPQSVYNALVARLNYNSSNVAGGNKTGNGKG